MRQLWLNMALVLLSSALLAQDTLVPTRLDTVSVIDSRSTSNAQSQIKRAVPEIGYRVLQHQSLAAVGAPTGTYIKSYGASNLATLAQRGLSAQQTQVLFEGFSLNSPMNGTIDLNLLPLALFSTISLYTPNEAFVYAPGSFAGSLNLQSRVGNDTLQVDLQQEVGSFDTYNTTVKLGGITGKWKQQGTFVLRRANNNYTFNNSSLAGSPEQTLSNAFFHQYAGGYNLAHQSGFSLKSITSYTDKGIPPTMLSVNNHELQNDWLNMQVLSFKKSFGKYLLDLSTGYKFESIEYSNALADIHEQSHSHNVFIKAEHAANYGWGRHQLSYRVIGRHNSQLSRHQMLPGNTYQPQTSVYGELTYDLLRDSLHKDHLLTLGLAAREQLDEQDLSPLLPKMFVRISRANYIFYTSVQRNYRYPTINDRYWMPGGNPNLKAEQGLNFEVSNKYFKALGHSVYINISNSFYLMRINNWILWQPTGFGYWAPENVRTVRSLGNETMLILQHYGRLEWQVYVKYHFNRATNLATSNPNDAAKGKLLIYSPQHLFFAGVYLAYRGWNLYYSQSYTGQRYINSDNSQALVPYTTGTVRLGKIFWFNRHNLELYVTVENLWDEQYQNVAWRPMPGRSYLGGITYTFAK